MVRPFTSTIVFVIVAIAVAVVIVDVVVVVVLAVFGVIFVFGLGFGILFMFFFLCHFIGKQTRYNAQSIVHVQCVHYVCVRVCVCVLFANFHSICS